MSEQPPSTYPMAPQVRARLMGVALVAIGLVLVLATLAVAFLQLSPDLLVIAGVLVLITIFGLGHLLVRRWYVVRLDPVGYRVRFVRGAGVTSARWADVAEVKSAEVAGDRCVVLALRDGRSTVVPVDLVAGGAAPLVEELRARLDAANGIRPLQ